MKANSMIRDSLKNNNVYQWQLAEALGIAEYTLTRLLRHELPTDKQNDICNVITELAERRNDKS